MTTRRSLYFAHPVNAYEINGSTLEKPLLLLLKRTWPDLEIINPGGQKHADMVQSLKSSDPKANVMGYFLDLVRECSTLVYLPFPDGKIGAGVWAEVEEALKCGCTIWSVDHKTHELTHVRALDQSLRLTIDETRARVYFPDRTIRPFE